MILFFRLVVRSPCLDIMYDAVGNVVLYSFAGRGGGRGV
jgi:hypothetical protein